jgi:curved DNA-binding protein
MTPDEALTVLGLDAGASAEVRKAVFRNRVKAARPDHPGGDAERFRRVIEANRVLEQAGARPAAAAAAQTASPIAPEVEITIEEACLGGARVLPIAGDKAFYWRIEPGLRDGDLVRESSPFGELTFTIRIAEEPDRKVMAGDLWITLGVDPWLLEDGGRIEVSTPFGPRNVLVPRSLPQEAMLRLKDCGLPKRGGYPQGHALVAPTARAALRAGMLR